MNPEAISGLLIGLVQIGAAFAGFSALVSVLRERGKETGAWHDILRLRIVISTSILVVGAGLFPLGLGVLGLEERWIWTASALLLILVNYAIFVSFLRSYQPVKNEFPADKLAVFVVGGLELLDQAALVTIVLNVMPEKSHALYVVALILNILQAAFVFLRYIGSEFRADHS